MSRKHLITFEDWTKDEINELLDISKDLKNDGKNSR